MSPWHSYRVKFLPISLRPPKKYTLMGGFWAFLERLPRPLRAARFSWASCWALMACTWAAVWLMAGAEAFLPPLPEARRLPSAFFFPAAGAFSWAFLGSAFLAGVFLGSAFFCSALPRVRCPSPWAGFFLGPAIFPIFGASAAPLRTWSCWRPLFSPEGVRRARVFFFSFPFSATRCSSLREFRMSHTCTVLVLLKSSHLLLRS